MLLPSVFTYKNYRLFLNDFYKAKKSSSAGYSYRQFSLEAKITSPNLLKLVIDGTKNLTTSTILKFATALDFDREETCFFETLVLENQATDSKEQQYYAAKIRATAQERSPRTVRISSRTQLFDHALLPAMVVLMAGRDATESVDEIAKRIGVHHGVINSFLKGLENEGVLTILAGRYNVNFEHAIFARKPIDRTLKNYIRKQLDLSVKAFNHSYEKPESKFITHTMGVSRANLANIRESLDQAIAKINSEQTSEPAEEVLQINIQAFLLTHGACES